MKKNNTQASLTLIPAGGLANRMRAIASAYHLCQQTNAHLKIIWFRDWALNAPFKEIFQPFNLPGIELHEAGWSDLLVHDRPRKRNLWIPRFFQKMKYEACIYEQQITPLKLQGFDFESWQTNRQCYMSCYQEFGAFSEDLYQMLFSPVKRVTNGVESHVSQFSNYTIGMHIRRTDHLESTTCSPTEMFIEAGKQELQKHPDMKIFLATDDNNVKDELKAVFGDKVITATTAASRSNAEGIREGLVDLYTLASTKRIYGSAGSSFSPMAAKIGKCDIVEMRKE